MGCKMVFLPLCFSSHFCFLVSDIFFTHFFFFTNEVPIHIQFFNKYIMCYIFIFYLFISNRIMKVNLYKSYFLSSHFSFQSNKRDFHPSTYPPQTKHHDKIQKSLLSPLFSIPQSSGP